MRAVAVGLIVLAGNLASGLLGNPAAAAPSTVSAAAPPGASSCSGCHAESAAVVTPVPRLIGRKPAEIVAAMQAFKSGQRSATVMDRIAKGFSDDEIQAIAQWYGARQEMR